MMKPVIIVSIMLAAALVMAQDVKKDDAKKDQGKPQTTCPVMEGQKINKSLYVDYEGKRVYVCCKACVNAVTKDPAKYVKKLESEGIAVEKIQTTCPVTGDKIDKKLFVDYKGKRVYLCCQGCVDGFDKEPDKYIKQLEDAGITLDKTPADKGKK